MDKDKLVKNYIYEVAGAKFNVAIWNGEVFRGPGYVDKKLVFVEEGHFDDKLPMGTCKPIDVLGGPLTENADGANLLQVLRILDYVVLDRRNIEKGITWQ